MFRRKLLRLGVFCLLAVAAILALAASVWCWSAWQVPADPEQVTLYSIDGTYKPGGHPLPPGEGFHSYPILGKIEITDPARQRQIMAALRRGMARATPVTGANCFWPRHALRVADHGREIDYIICFECSNIEIFQGDSRKSTVTTAESLAEFNRILRENGVPLAPSPFPDGQ